MSGEGHNTAIVVAVIGLVGILLAAFIELLPSLGIFDSGDGDGFIPTWPEIVNSDGGRQQPGPGPSDGGETLPTGPVTERAEIYLSATSAPAGESINVSGEGFSPGERVVIRVQTDEVASTEANGNGAFSNVAIVIPEDLSVFAPEDFTVIATGQDSVRSARAEITVSR